MEDIYLMNYIYSEEIPQEILECPVCGAMNSKENHYCWACDTKLN